MLPVAERALTSSRRRNPFRLPLRLLCLGTTNVLAPILKIENNGHDLTVRLVANELAILLTGNNANGRSETSIPSFDLQGSAFRCGWKYSVPD